MNNYRKDEIKLKYFLPFALYKWRIIITAGLLCGFLLGSLRVIRGVLLWDAQMENYQACLELYEEEYQFYENEISYYTKRIADLQQMINGNFKNTQRLTEAQNVLDSLTEPVLEQVPPTIEHTVIRVLEFTVIGIIIGMIGAVYIYFVKYKRNGIMYSLEEFERMTDIYILGVFEQLKKNSKEGFDEKIIDRINTHILSHRSNHKKVMLMGQIEDDLIQKIAKELEKNLSGVQLLTGCNKEENSEHIKISNICDATILVVQRGKSMIPEIIREVKLVESENVPILGAVIL